ncbi:DUF4349 domain-containing protein [Streptomyces sp. NPDC048595]|uniref:DUF4349 domain-containing protein n=1 Tax=Streptomyces sp. NPDC048595 TaxID=3365576 RepID=UPI00371C6C5C
MRRAKQDGGPSGRRRETGRAAAAASGGRARRAAVAGVLLAASLVVAGCSASSGESAAGDAAAPKGALAPSRAADGRTTGGGAAAEGAARPGERGGRAPRVAPSQIIRTATLTVQTKDVAAALARARAAVDGAGGYAADETTDRDPQGHDRSRIVLRVPPEEYDAVLGRLSGLGKLLSREVSAKDVTDQVVDVDSRIKSQRASVSRVRALMAKATTISDIVSLESELSTRESNLESLEAELKSLKERTGMATVTLLLRQPDAGAPGDQEEPASFSDALSGGWQAWKTALRWALVTIGAVLPFAVTAALLYVLWRLVRDRLPGASRLRRRTAGAGGDPIPADGADDAPKTSERAAAAAAPDTSEAAGRGEGDRGPR